MRPFDRVSRILTLLPTLLIGLPIEAAAQLRPYEPFAWEMFDQRNTVSLSAGTRLLWGQRASLAGTEGRLAEVGNLLLFVRTGRVTIEAGGTVHRILSEREAFAPTFEGTNSQDLGRRRDSGDYRVSTAIRLTPDDARALGTLRFGTRLPTTDNRVGLERDRTDFFALVGGRIDFGQLRVTAEAGLGIHGTRNPDFEQSDLFLFAAGMAGRFEVVEATLLLLGHTDGLDGWTIRGNERLTELRAQIRSGAAIGEPIWVQLDLIRGLTAFSPDLGVGVSIGATL